METTAGMEPGIALASVLMAVLFVSLISIAVNVIICFFIYTLYKAVPEQHQKLSPGLVWLLLIPCFSLVWNFWVFPRLSQSYAAGLAAVGDTSAGDCNAMLAMVYCVVFLGTLIPCVNWIAGIAALVVVIIYLVKMNDLKARISAPAAAV